MHDVEQYINFNTSAVDDAKFIQTLENAFARKDCAVVLYYDEYVEYNGSTLRDLLSYSFVIENERIRCGECGSRESETININEFPLFLCYLQDKKINNEWRISGIMRTKDVPSHGIVASEKIGKHNDPRRK